MRLFIAALLLAASAASAAPPTHFIGPPSRTRAAIEQRCREYLALKPALAAPSAAGRIRMTYFESVCGPDGRIIEKDEMMGVTNFATATEWLDEMLAELRADPAALPTRK